MDTPHELRQVDELWFSDGGVVIQAEHSLFRVPGALLAARSTVLRDMLPSVQPGTEPQATVDGCPVLYLPDSAMDVTYFLKAIFDSSFFERPPAGTEIDILLGVLRLSSKYTVEYLRKRCLLHLDTYYSVSLEAFDKWRDTITIGWEAKMSYAATILFHELGLIWLLPVSMYWAVYYDVASLLDGIQWRGSLIHLDPESQRACIIGRSELAVRQQRDIGASLATPLSGICGSPGVCNSVKRKCLQRLGKRGLVCPLETFWISDSMAGCCGTCASEWETIYSEARKKLWADLPGIFGLPDWDELRAMRATALE